MIKPRHVSHVEEDRLARTVCVENPEGDGTRTTRELCLCTEGRRVEKALRYHSGLFTKSAKSNAVSR